MRAFSGTAPMRAVPSVHREVMCKATRLNSSDKLLLAGLDKVLTQITSAIQRHESTKRLASGDVTVVVDQPGKLVKFSASSGLEKLVKEPSAGCTKKGKGLSAYLALPLDQYSLLDPKWITRPDPDTPDVFLLRVPLHDIMSLNLTPEVYIRVQADPSRSQVSFFADRFRLGDARFDSDFQLVMNATLRHKAVTDVGTAFAALFGAPRSSPSPAASQQPLQIAAASSAAPALPDWQASGDEAMRAGDAAAQSAFASAVTSLGSGDEESGSGSEGHSSSYASSPSSRPAAGSSQGSNVNGGSVTSSSGTESNGGASSNGDGSSGAAGVLRCDVDLKFQVLMPHPLSVVPGPLLALAGGLLARLAVQAMLPGFLDLLAVDYGRWASGAGRSQAVGDLVVVTPPPAASEDGEEEGVDEAGGVGVGGKLGATVASVAAAVPGAAAAAAAAAQDAVQ